MNAKAFTLLLGLAALAAVGAYFIAFKPAATPPGAPTAPGSAATTTAEARLAPALAERADEIATITISSGDTDPVVLTRDPDRENDGWLLASKADFPAEPDRVRQLITTLSELRTVEPKTAKPELHNRLAVQWPDDTDRDPEDFSPRPTLVSITDADGEPIAEIVLGETTYAGGGPRQYARLLGDNQSWLVNASVTIPRGPLGFVNTRFVELPRDSVQSVTITHADGETLELTRDDPDADFTVANLPEGATMKNQALANNTGNALAFVNFTDVEKIDPVPLPPFGTLAAPTSVAPAGVLESGEVAALSQTFDGRTMALIIEPIREEGRVSAGWVSVFDNLEKDEVIIGRFNLHRFKLPAGTIESLTRKPSELIETPATDNADPTTDNTPGRPPPTDD